MKSKRYIQHNKNNNIIIYKMYDSRDAETNIVIFNYKGSEKNIVMP